jgi:hypothetical protein
MKKRILQLSVKFGLSLRFFQLAFSPELNNLNEISGLEKLQILQRSRENAISRSFLDPVSRDKARPRKDPL